MMHSNGRQSVRSRRRGAASWSEIPEPSGCYYVTRISSGEDVLRCTLEVTGRLLQVNYEILENALTAADCRTLILSTI